MSAGGVTLLRSAAPSARGLFAVAATLAALGAPVPAHAATGGAPLPGGASASPPEPPAPAEESTTAQQASQSELTPPMPALPLLPAVDRQPTDPPATDLAALREPSPIAAVDGHVVYVRQHMGRTELVDVATPSSPRILLSGTREFGPPSAGRDAAGHPVVVLSPCAGTEEVVLQGQAPRCPLRAVDLSDGSSRALAATTGALAGDLAGDRLIFTRRAGRHETRLYSSAGDSATVVALPQLGTTGEGWLPSHGKPSPGSVRVAGLDVDGTGRVAAIVEYRATRPSYSSSLWLRSAAGEWRRITTLGTQGDGQGTRQVLAPSLDDGGVRAYVEGVVEAPSFVGRWTDAGALTTKLSLRRSIGRATILHGAAYDGDRLVFVDWLPGVPCGSEAALACGLRAAGPLSVR